MGAETLTPIGGRVKTAHDTACLVEAHLLAETMGSVRVLGVDPGSHKTGWGVIDARASRLQRIASGTILAKGGSLGARLLCIAEALEEVLQAHRPDAVALERIFHAKNSDSAIKLGHARGVAVLCAARAGASIFEYSPSEVKQAATGRGAGTKDQVQQMVSDHLGLRCASWFG